MKKKYEVLFFALEAGARKECKEENKSPNTYLKIYRKKWKSDQCRYTFGPLTLMYVAVCMIFRQLFTSCLWDPVCTVYGILSYTNLHTIQVILRVSILILHRISELYKCVRAITFKPLDDLSWNFQNIFLMISICASLIYFSVKYP